MRISYKPAGEEDIRQIFTMCKQLIDRYEQTQQIDYDKVLRWVEKKIKDNISQYTCIFADAEKVGYYRLHTDNGLTELDDFYILPEFRRKGIGTTVLRKCLQETNNPIYLYVFKQNEGAIRLYEKLGFIVTETIGTTRQIMRYAG